MIASGSDVKVDSVGIVLSTDRPGLGARLDGLVFDPSAEIQKGDLEVKCPFSKTNLDISNDCSDNAFYLKSENGTVHLKRNNNYYYQVQGQMYVPNLKWVDLYGLVRKGDFC